MPADDSLLPPPPPPPSAAAAAADDAEAHAPIDSTSLTLPSSSSPTAAVAPAAVAPAAAAALAKPLDAPQSPISPPQERQSTPPTTGKQVSASGPTPPQSANASPRVAPMDAAAAVSDDAATADVVVDHDAASQAAAQSDAVVTEGTAAASSQDQPMKEESNTSKHPLGEGEGPAEPPTKRVRVDEGTAVKFIEQDPETLMTPNRQKYCLVVLRQLKRSKDAAPFLHPVDPVKLKIPDYFKIVTNPQDLGTIEAKLKKLDFTTIDEFIDSVQLVWSNCQRYNGAEAAINLMALRLKEQFERQIRSMPPAEPVDSKPGSAKKGKKPGKGVAASGVQAGARSRTTSSPAAVPAIRRESVGVDGRPKREIHAPPSKSLPYQTMPQKRGKNAAQLKFCGQVLKELTHKKHEQFAFPFYQPVDVEGLGLHDYHTVIKRPMDLATMQHKLSNSAYDSADDFEYDMRLMFRNCYKYNGPGLPVHAMGKRLEAVFNEKWAEKPIQKPGGYGSDSDEESEEDDASKQTVRMLKKQLAVMQNQIDGMHSQKKKKKAKKERFDDDDDDDDGGMGPSDRDYKTQPNKKGKGGGASGGGRDANNDGDESPMFPSFDQKRALSNKMSYMTEHQMPIVIQILKRTDPNFDPEDEEVELDVDKVHPKTIRLLWNWIMDGVQPSFLRKKVVKTKKNRNILSESEQQRQIQQLEAQLHKFEGGDDAYGHISRDGGVPNDDSSDGDSDVSSEEDD